ncbi:MAG: type IV pilus modification PilV family protein [Phycisphaerales bacterium]
MRRAFTLVEVALSTVIVAGLLVAALTVAGRIAVSRRAAQDAARAHALAHQLMDEILTFPYSSSADGTLSAGPSAAEVLAGRAGYSEIGDFAGLIDSPIVDRADNRIEGAGGLRRTVAVSFAEPATPSVKSNTETGCVRITVSIARSTAPTIPIASITSFRTRGWDVAHQRLGTGSQGLVGTVVSTVTGLLGGK